MEPVSLSQILRKYAVVLAAPVLLLAPPLLTGRVLFWGTPSLQFVSWWVYVAGCLRQGSLPLWNDLNGMGAPLLANYQVAILYPPHWLLLLLAFLGGAGAVAVGFTLLSILHLAWAGLGMALLLRNLRFPWLAQVLGGLAFGLSGYLLGRIQFFPMVWAAAWLPWIILFTDRLAALSSAESAHSRPRISLSLGLAACLAMQLLAGHAQLTWYTLLLAGVWLTVFAFLRGGFRTLPRAWMSLADCGLLAAGISAVQLLPTTEYLRLSYRAGAVAYADAMVYSFWPWRFLTLFAPGFFGSPVTGDFWGYASYWEDHVYTGLLPLLLALASLVLLVRGFRKSRRDARWPLLALLWGLLVVTFLLALGRYAPVFPFLYRYVPTFAMFQAPARYLIWAAFAFPLLAAVGVEHWRYPTGRGLYWFRLATAGAFAITLGAGLATILLRSVKATFIRATALAGMWGLGFGLLTLLIPFAARRGWTRYWQAAVITWTLADLLVSGYGLNPVTSLAFYQGASDAAARVRASGGDARVYLPQTTEYDLKFRRFLRFTDFRPREDWRGMRDVLIPNLNLLDGVPSANNFDPLQPQSYARWVTEINNLEAPSQAGWLALAGVGALERIDSTQPSGVRFDPIPNADRWRWYACAVSVDSAGAAWAKLKTEMLQPPGESRPVILEGTPRNLGDCAAQTPAAIQRLSQRPDLLVFRVDAPNPGWFVLADTWYPGWQAQDGSRRLPIYRADGNFRAVWLETGVHQISFLYRPIGFTAGVILSILGLLLVIALSWIRGKTP